MEQKLQTYIAQETGQIISFDGVKADAGQCVQNVAKWCQFLGMPVEWENAADWFLNETSAFSQKWTKVVNNPNDPNQLPSPGDIVVFSKSLPGSDNFGHIDIFVKSLGNHEWQGFDSNWDGLSAKLVTHTWAYVLGWYTPKEAPAPAPAPTTPVASPASPSSVAPSTQAVQEGSFEVVAEINGYQTANDAANHEGNAVPVHPGTYEIFNQYKGMVNVTLHPGQPGSWINPNDNHASSNPAPTAGPNYDGNAVTIQPGWGLSNAAEAAGWPDAGQPARWQAIAQLNGNNDWQAFNASLKTGQRIVVGKYNPPAPAPEAPAPPAKPSNTVYTKWEGPTDFVTNKNPTHVWLLDFVNDTEAHSAVDLGQGAPVKVYGKAQRTDGDKPVYLMTEEDFGKADETGTPNNNRGVNIVDLSPAPAPSAATPAPSVPAATPAAAPAHADSEVETVPVTVKHWQDNINVYAEPVKDEVTDNVQVSDLEGKLPGVHQLVKGQPVTIGGDTGDFTVNGVKYAFTETSIKNKTYIGIPVGNLKKLSVVDEDSAVFAGLLDEIETDVKKVGGVIKAAEANKLVSRLLKKK